MMQDRPFKYWWHQEVKGHDIDIHIQQKCFETVCHNDLLDGTSDELQTRWVD